MASIATASARQSASVASLTVDRDLQGRCSRKRSGALGGPGSAAQHDADDDRQLRAPTPVAARRPRRAALRPGHVDTSVRVTLTVLAETQKLRRGAAPEPELPAARAGQGSQHRAIELRRCLHHGTQAGDALVPLAKLDQAIAE